MTETSNILLDFSKPFQKPKKMAKERNTSIDVERGRWDFCIGDRSDRSRHKACFFSGKFVPYDASLTPAGPLHSRVSGGFEHFFLCYTLQLAWSTHRQIESCLLDDGRVKRKADRTAHKESSSSATLGYF